ncbi:MAG: EfeM/EfeO family lipoprotein [Myxococcaceae bacterium]|nr:EfeM/EfeO family lipoprotein [Myxococcaceae bacterium]
MRHAVALIALVAACGSPKPPEGPTDAEQREKITTGMHQALLTEIQVLKGAAQDLKAHAPVRSGAAGWELPADAAAIAQLKLDWAKARTAYEHIEGAIAPLFPEIDLAIDGRYDDHLEGLNGLGDPNPFDGQGVIGMHGIERILWADSIPPGVTRVESTLPGYAAAAFPTTEAEARDFKEKLVTQLVSDVQKLETQWSPAKIDLAGAFQGLEALMVEQREKVNNASNNLEESRYSQATMRDLRDNLAGTRTIYRLFQPWLKTKGSDVDARIEAGFDALDAAYDEVQGDSIPAPPDQWSAEMPRAEHLGTPFGKLYTKVRAATDATVPGSLATELAAAGVLMGFPSGM